MKLLKRFILAKKFGRIEPAHLRFIQQQKIFFNASASTQGRVNVSPRGTATLRILDANTVAYLDLTGSGNETAAHLLANGRLTLMFCAFEGAPMILRIYGTGQILHRSSTEYSALLISEFGDTEPIGARQIVVLTVDLVTTSCGYGVPLFQYVKERDTLKRWGEAKGAAGLENYWRENNTRSIDGLPTGLLDDEA